MDAERRPTEEKWSNCMSTFIAVALIASGAPAQADTAVCLGNLCTVTSRDGTNHERSLSDINEEARKESLENIRDVDCSVADDASKCLKAKLTLQRLFY